MVFHVKKMICLMVRSIKDTHLIFFVYRIQVFFDTSGISTRNIFKSSKVNKESQPSKT